jgi:hypothetical protein
MKLLKLISEMKNLNFRPPLSVSEFDQLKNIWGDDNYNHTDYAMRCFITSDGEEEQLSEDYSMSLKELHDAYPELPPIPLKELYKIYQNSDNGDDIYRFSGEIINILKPYISFPKLFEFSQDLWVAIFGCYAFNDGEWDEDDKQFNYSKFAIECMRILNK